MPKPQLDPLNLGSIARGAALELFEKAISDVGANIANPDTPATKARKITIEFTLKPDVERRRIDITTSLGVKLASVNNHASRAYLGKDTEGKVHVFDSDPRQDILFEQPKEEDNLLKFITPEA
jgi:flagellar basal body rod protein FlgB